MVMIPGCQGVLAQNDLGCLELRLGPPMGDASGATPKDKAVTPGCQGVLVQNDLGCLELRLAPLLWGAVDK